jgi:hypothetical protein
LLYQKRRKNKDEEENSKCGNNTKDEQMVGFY